MTPADISVVIPALNEEAVIGRSIQSAVNAGATEIIVSDGGSTDETQQRSREFGATKVIRSIPGRGIQLNAGALFSSGQYVLFLHADNWLDAKCLEQICDASEPAWGAFEQQIDSSRRAFRWIEYGNALRVRFRSMAFGDQAIFVRRDIYKREGGFDEIELMEDVALSKKLRRIGKPILLSGPVTISPRRWETHGIVKQTIKNWSLQCGYKIGVSPSRLATWYRQ